MADGTSGSGAARRAARAILLDEDGRVLLLQGRDVTRPEAGTWWFTPGGGLHEGEGPEEAARREVFEETGISLGGLGPVVLERESAFDFEDVHYHQQETFYLVRVPHQKLRPQQWTEMERRSIIGHRWWAVDELPDATEPIYPPQLEAVLRAAAEGSTTG